MRIRKLSPSPDLTFEETPASGISGTSAHLSNQLRASDGLEQAFQTSRRFDEALEQQSRSDRGRATRTVLAVLAGAGLLLCLSLLLGGKF